MVIGRGKVCDARSDLFVGHKSSSSSSSMVTAQILHVALRRTAVTDGTCET